MICHPMFLFVYFFFQDNSFPLFGTVDAVQDSRATEEPDQVHAQEAQRGDAGPPTPHGPLGPQWGGP